jgi:putative zinc finger/helix-turn-helix YgiT family protein
MKSPINGKEMILKKEKRSVDFRKESFEIQFHFYLCEESEEQFTTTELDDINLKQVYNQYRSKHSIPFSNEIKTTRKKYGLSAAKMSEILGFGTNTYRLYEGGEIPSIANARLLKIAEDSLSFKSIVRLWESKGINAKDKLLDKIDDIVERESKNAFKYIEHYLLGENSADIYTGYQKPNIDKISEMVVYFSEKLEPFKTKLNKLLFFTDFLMFKNSCYSVSGLRYRAIDMGPVPNNFQTIFEHIVNSGIVDIEYKTFQKGFVGEKFIGKKEREFNSELFSEKELEILDKVFTKFSEFSTTEIIEHSHLEKAWKENNESRSLISYDYAFELTDF